MKIFTRVFLVIAILSIHAQSSAQSIQWIHDAGSSPLDANENGTAVDVDGNGNAYVIGHLSIDSYFSGFLVPAQEDGCLAKYNAAGSLQWVRSFGGPGSVDIQESAVKVSSIDSAIYVCGSFRTQFLNSTVSFDSISFTYAGNSRHAFLAKYDLNGNIQWMKHGGGTGLGSGFNDIDIDDQGRIVVVGTVEGTNIFDTLSVVYDGGVLLRYLPDGTLSDFIQLNDTIALHQEAREVEVAPGSGNIYVGGAFFDSISINGFNAYSSVFNVFEIKLDSGFNCQWLSTGGGSSGTWANGLALDGFENSYITGHASGDTIRFGTYYFNGHSSFDSEIITFKIDSTGSVHWLRSGGSTAEDKALDIVADDNGNTIITGFLGGNVPFADFDGIQVPIFTQSTHCFIAHYDSSGQIIYAKVMGGGSNDAGLGLELSSDSTFYLTGTAQSSAPWDTILYVPCCLDPNFIIARFSNAFTNISTGIEYVTSPEFSIFPNPFTSFVTIEFLSNNTETTRIEIYDLAGRIVKAFDKKEFMERSITIDLSDLNIGLYICILKSNDTNAAIKINKIN